MFPLAGEAFPQDRHQLEASLTQSLQTLFKLPPGSPIKRVETAGEFPALDLLRVDLTNAAMGMASPPPKPEPAGHPAPGLTAARLEVLAQPLRVESAAVSLRLEAQTVALDFDRDKRTGQPLLVLSAATAGSLDVAITHQDLQTLLLAGARTGAKAHGVAIDKTDMILTSKGPRSVAIDLHVTASKLFLKTTLRLQGTLDIDDSLAMRISDLSVQGEGTRGGLASSLVRPKLASLEGHAIPLAAFSLGSVRLRELNIDVTGGLHVSAKFGT